MHPTPVRLPLLTRCPLVPHRDVCINGAAKMRDPQNKAVHTSPDAREHNTTTLSAEL